MAQEETLGNRRNIDVNQKILSSIDNGIIILDDELTILYFNRWLELHTGQKAEDIIGHKIYEIFQEINSKTLLRKVNTALTMGTPTFYTASTSKYLIPIKIDQIKTSTFTHMRQDVSLIPIDTENSLVAVVITDQTNMAYTNMLLEENIKKVSELNKELIKERDTIDKKVLLLKYNGQGMITDVSQAYLELLGYEKDELIDHNLFEFERLHINSHLRSEILEHMQNYTSHLFEHKTLSREGKEFWFKNTLVPEFDVNMRHIGYILFKENVTDTKKVISQQEKLLANSRSAAMGEMVSMIAHQWRQPLAVITTILATLKVKSELGIVTKEVMSENFTKIEKTVKYLSDTIDDFRDFFKPNKIFKLIHMQDIFNKSTILLKGEMKLIEIEYREKIDPALQIETYQNELIQVIISILKNSVDAFKESSVQNPYIEVTTSLEKNHLMIYIEDNAGGISPETLAHVFEPYFSTKSKNGTGLGLYMCKTIVEEHLHGKITIISEDGYTRAVIELPYAIRDHINTKSVYTS